MRISTLSSFLRYTLLAAILAGSFAFMLHASRQESAIMDELAHIPAGYGYVKLLDGRLNPEHPPLVKMIAAAPLAFMNLRFPTDDPAWTTAVNGQWDIGSAFLYRSGNDADRIIQWARLGPMLLTLALILLVFFWSQELMGPWWAFVPTILTAFAPNILAHGHYVTTDIGATIGFLIAIHAFAKYTLHNTRKHLAYAGIAFGIAQLLKFSTVLLIPLFVFLTIAFAFTRAFSHRVSLWTKLANLIKHAARGFASLIGIFAIGYLLIYLVYLPITLRYPAEKQLTDTTTILAPFANGTQAPCSITRPTTRCLANFDIWMAKHTLARPLAQYGLGVLMVVQRASGGNTSYFLGNVSSSGWWYYFPTVFLFKEPLPALIMLGAAFLLGAWTFLKNFRSGRGMIDRFHMYLSLNFAEFAMLSFIVLYWTYSMRGNLNIGVRHVLPTIPLMYILAAGKLRAWARQEFDLSAGFLRNLATLMVGVTKASLKAAAIIFLLFWSVSEAAFASPYFLSYFNEAAGGVDNGFRQVADSNYDWGQDLKRLAQFADRERIDRIAIDYFGGGSMPYYLGTRAVSWNSAMGNPKQQGIQWFAVSINNLQQALGTPIRGFERKPADEYRWLRAIKNPYQPDARIGTTIFAYRLR